MSQPIIMYGATDCDDTEHIRHTLAAWGIAFTEVNIDHDVDAEQFVTFINQGYRSTPTLVIGAGKHKTILTEPTPEQLESVLAQAGYSISPSK